MKRTWLGKRGELVRCVDLANLCNLWSRRGNSNSDLGVSIDILRTEPERAIEVTHSGVATWIANLPYGGTPMPSGPTSISCTILHTKQHRNQTFCGLKLPQNPCRSRTVGSRMTSISYRMRGKPCNAKQSHLRNIEFVISTWIFRHARVFITCQPKSSEVIERRESVLHLLPPRNICP